MIGSEFDLVSQSQQICNKTTKAWQMKRAKPCCRIHTHRWYIMICSKIENAINNMFTNCKCSHTIFCRWSVGQQSTLRMFTISRPSPWLVSYILPDWNWLRTTKRKILLKTCVYTAHNGHLLHFWNYLIVGCLAGQDGRFCIFKTISSYAAFLTRIGVFAFLKLFHRRLPIWPGWTCFSTLLV